MYKRRKEYPFILSVNFNKHYRVWPTVTILKLKVTVTFKEYLLPDFVWKGKCFVTKKGDIKWKFSSKFPEFIRNLVKELYPDKTILKIIDNIQDLSKI